MPGRTYEALALLQEHTDLTLEALARHLRERYAPFPELQVRPEANGLRVTDPRGTLHVRQVEGGHVAGEAKDLARQFRRHPMAAEMKACRRRLEIWTADDDPDVLLLETFRGLCNAVNDFGGVIVVNLTDRTVLDKDGEEDG
jgi:hypothetical protein